MDGWFLLSVGISLALSFTFLVIVTDDLKSQVSELRGRIDMLLGALEECRMADLTRNAQGKIVNIVIRGDVPPGSRSDSKPQ